MRRGSPNVVRLFEEQQKLLAALTGTNAESVVRVLREHVTPERAARLTAILEQRLDSVTVVMDAPHDPHNGGAVLRSCDVFGVQRLHVLERRETFLAAKSVSRGSERWVDVRAYLSASELFDTLRAGNFTLVATHPKGELEPNDLRAFDRVAIVLGNERLGIQSDLSARCKHRIRIPMRGFAESLNVSVTAAILLQIATSGRKGDLAKDERMKLYARALVLTLRHAPEILAAHGIYIDLPPSEL